jgi:alpha-glucosidase
MNQPLEITKGKIVPNRQSEVIYQIYPASFKDSNGDGHGDLKGITEKLDYIKSLNVDAIWISPFFLSPEGEKGDGGYAVTDHRKIGPKFGTMEDFDKLLETAHKKGLRVYTDFVMCHTSDEHEWFKNSRDNKKGFEDRYVWNDGKKDEKGNLIKIDGKPIPPNNWKSVFKGKNEPAWTFDNKRNQFYMHHFAPSQPALNANERHVQDAVIKEMKWWLDKGVDGLRLDAVPFANYDKDFKDNTYIYGRDGNYWDGQNFDHSMCQKETENYLKRIRGLFDSYASTERGKRIAIGEAIAGKIGGGASMEVAKDYVHPETGIHTCYTEPPFWPDYSRGKTSGYPSAEELKNHVKNIEEHFPGGSMCNYMSNHDFSRAASRMLPANLPEELRTTVLKQIMTLNFSLPGSVCMYQGEELGLPDARIPEDIPHDKIRDTLGGRDIARAGMPWNPDDFSESKKHYLPLPQSYGPLAVSLQESQDTSMLNFTRNLIKQRQDNPALRTGKITVLKNTPNDVFAFLRYTDEQTVLCAFNMGNNNITLDLTKTMDQETRKKIGAEKEIIMGPFEYTRRGLKGVDKEVTLTAKDLQNGHKGIKIFTADLLIAAATHSHDKISHIDQSQVANEGPRISIGEEIHNKLLKASDKSNIDVGGATLGTLHTLKKLQSPGHLHVSYLGAVGDDEHGKIIKNHLKDSGIDLLTSHLSSETPVKTAVSHFIKNGSQDITATYAGNEASALGELLGKDKKLLEKSIATSDVIYLPGSITEKLGDSLTNDILHLRWRYGKEMILALPSHATFGPSDPQKFKKLIRSSNMVVGNDSEFCRVFGINGDRPVNDETIDILTNKIQKEFKIDVLKNNIDTSNTSDPVAFITRGDKGAVIVTKNKVIPVPPVPPKGKATNINGVGDVAMAAFLDAELRGLRHKDAGKFAMAMAAKKLEQKDDKPFLVDVSAAREKVIEENPDIAKNYHKINATPSPKVADTCEIRTNEIPHKTPEYAIL